MPALAETSAPLSPLLSRKNEYVWTPECQASFENLNKQVANIVGLKHFAVYEDIRIVCDASHKRLGAVLEQLGIDDGGWLPISFASRYLNDAEKRYSTNELEMLAVDCYHKAFVSLLNGKNKKNKVQPSNQTVR